VLTTPGAAGGLAVIGRMLVAVAVMATVAETRASVRSEYFIGEACSIKEWREKTVTRPTA
jgi:hypothetical protein